MDDAEAGPPGTGEADDVVREAHENSALAAEQAREAAAHAGSTAAEFPLAAMPPAGPPPEGTTEWGQTTVGRAIVAAMPAPATNMEAEARSAALLTALDLEAAAPPEEAAKAADAVDAAFAAVAERAPAPPVNAVAVALLEQHLGFPLTEKAKADPLLDDMIEVAAEEAVAGPRPAPPLPPDADHEMGAILDDVPPPTDAGVVHDDIAVAKQAMRVLSVTERAEDLAKATADVANSDRMLQALTEDLPPGSARKFPAGMVPDKAIPPLVIPQDPITGYGRTDQFARDPINGGGPQGTAVPMTAGIMQPVADGAMPAEAIASAAADNPSFEAFIEGVKARVGNITKASGIFQSAFDSEKKTFDQILGGALVQYALSGQTPRFRIEETLTRKNEPSAIEVAARGLASHLLED